MSTEIYFGIDTSNYTTSAAAITTAGEVFCAKRPLSVPLGNRGMRQSDALFCHTRDLREVVSQCLSRVREKHSEFDLLAVGVSDKPRPVEGSYMPCFLAGVNAADCAASLAGVPLFTFSHQEGHIEAARLGAASLGKPLSDSEFFAFHLSGGTTELVSVKEKAAGYETKILSSALDVTLGQLIDRCGVMLGLSFPAGAELERLAQTGVCREKIRISANGEGINLSGFENRFQKKREAGESKENLARFVFSVGEEAIRALLSPAGREEKKVLFSGGVSSSVLLKKAFSGERFFFAPPEYCADNAIGIAGLVRKGVERGTHPHDRNGSE